MKLSEHFTLEELTFSDMAARLGIDNSPPKIVIDNLAMLCVDILEPLRNAIGTIHINSGYRGPALNKAIGGSKNSAHMSGLAADIRSAKLQPVQVCEKIIAMQLDYDQVILEFARWTHVAASARGLVPRHDILTIDNGGTRIGLHGGLE